MSASPEGWNREALLTPAEMAEADRRGWLKVEDPRLAAEQFLGMLKGDIFLKRILGLSGAEDGLEREIEAAVAVIIKAYAPGA